MLGYLAHRLPSAVIVLVGASILIFFVLRLAPGDPAATLAGPDASLETIAAIRSNLGLDSPLYVQYFDWLKGVVTGDLGTSYVMHAPISTLIGNSLGSTVQLTVAAIIFAVVLGGFAGIVLGTSRRRPVQIAMNSLNSLAFAVPTYVTGVLLVLVFAVTLRLLPAGGQGPGLSDPTIGVQYLLMPAFALSLPTAATLARFLAGAMRQTRDEDFVQTAVAKGLPSRRITFAHVIPNSLPPVLTILGIEIGQLLSGAIIVETIFAWPGIGQLLIGSVIGRDYLLTQDLLLLAVFVFVIVQIVTDIIDAAVDPRVRLGHS